MNKTIIININSIVFHIEEDAYETLRSYMIEIKRHFSGSTDSGEILQDIENRIAEMFNERIHQGKKEVISMSDVKEVITQMGRVSDFETDDDAAAEPIAPADEPIREETRFAYLEKKLMRNPDDKVVGGVCSGLAYYFDIHVRWVRVLFVLFFLLGGSSVLLYVVLWAVMPLATSRADRMSMRGEEPNLQNFKKSFEEEIDPYRDDFSSAKTHLAKNSKAFGGALSDFFRLLGKGIALCMLIFCGMAIFGLLFVWVGFCTGILGYQDGMVFPPTEYLPKGHALIAITAGVLANAIPFIALFYIFLRIVFQTKPMNTYLSLSLWAGWIVSVITILFYIFWSLQDFKQSTVIKVDKPLAVQNVYHLSEKDIHVIEASMMDDGEKKYSLDGTSKLGSGYFRDNIDIKFQYLDSLEKPFIQYSYFAKGKTAALAAERASKINYLAKQTKGKILFDSHFVLPSKQSYREQSVSVVMFLPIGSKVTIDESLQYKVWDLPYLNCLNEYANLNSVKQTEWIMKKSGLSCAPAHVEQSKKEKNKGYEATDNDEEASDD